MILGNSDEWKDPAFRQGVVLKLQEAIDLHGNVLQRSATSVEDYLFKRAKSQRDYLESAARIMVYLKNQSQRSSAVRLETGEVEADPDQDPAGVVVTDDLQDSSTNRMIQVQESMECRR